jgi:hypothetical protein
VHCCGLQYVSIIDIVYKLKTLSVNEMAISDLDKIKTSYNDKLDLMYSSVVTRERLKTEKNWNIEVSIG